MKIYTLTTKENYFTAWQKLLGDRYVLKRIDVDNFINDITLLSDNSILIIDLSTCKDIFVNTANKNMKVFENLHIIGLSNIPNIHECLGLLTYGIKAYGNNFMEQSFFEEMLDKVIHNQMWFPELILEDVIRVALHSKEQKQKLDNLDILTPREQEVAFNVAQGLSNKEIAKKLSLSAETVKIHLTHVYKKLDIDNRVALALRLKV